MSLFPRIKEMLLGGGFSKPDPTKPLATAWYYAKPAEQGQTSIRFLAGAARPRIRLCPTRFRRDSTTQGAWIGLRGRGRHDLLLFRWIGRGPLTPRNSQAGPCFSVSRDLACRCFHGRAWSVFSRAHAPRRNHRLHSACAFRGRRSEALQRN